MLRATEAAFVLLGALLALTVLGIVPPLQLLSVFAVLVFTSSSLIPYVAARAWMRGLRGAPFVALGFGVMWAGTVVATLRAFDVVPTNGITSYALQIASGVEMVVFALALADRVRFERVQRESAQMAALASEQSRVEELRGAEERLERIVHERTRELRRTVDRERETLNQYVRFGVALPFETAHGIGYAFTAPIEPVA